jgi:hypothetical protein
MRRVVAAFHALDLHHLGAQVGQDGAGERAGQHLAQLQHAHTLKHTGHVHAPSGCLLYSGISLDRGGDMGSATFLFL